jgi:hypothetical protein
VAAELFTQGFEFVPEFFRVRPCRR